MIPARLQAALLPLVAVAVVLGVLVLLADGRSPSSAAVAIWQGAFADRAAWGATLEKATPLVFSGLAVLVALRAGLFNIGAQGQLLVGSVMAAYAGFRLSGLPAAVHVPLVLAVGVAAGALPALLAGLLKAVRGVHEVIVTIMLNTVLVNLTDWLAGGPWREPSQPVSRTPPIAPSAAIPRLGGLPLGFVLAVAMVVVSWIVLERTTWGFRLVTMGRNPHAAHYAGMSVTWVTIAAMTVSGALAGMGGAVETQGVVGRFEAGFNRGLGFDGITIALLAKGAPPAVIPAALLIGALRASSTQLQSTAQVPPEIVDVVLAIVLLLVAAPMLLRRILGQRAVAGDALAVGSRWTS